MHTAAKPRHPRLHKPAALLALLVAAAIAVTAAQLLTLRFQPRLAVNRAAADATPPAPNSSRPQPPAPAVLRPPAPPAPPALHPNLTAVPRPPAPPKPPPHKDLFFTPSGPPRVLNAAHPRHPPCVIFSCTDAGYFLVEPHLRLHGARLCDRVHFTGRTTDETGATVPPVWCRVALLRSMPALFRPYRKLVYTDVDVVYDEHGLLALPCGPGLKGVIVSTKVERARTVLRIPWFVICDRRDQRVVRMVHTWASNHREVYLRDQTVFNENWRCAHVTCYNRTIAKTAELRHCGSWLPNEDRLKCFQTT